MYRDGAMQCVSFHWSKILGIQQGGAILHDDPDADRWFRKARFDGRTEGVPPKEDTFETLGYHCYLSPETAAQGLVRLSFLPPHNDDLPNSDYPDLSQIPLFQKSLRRCQEIMGAE
jgi:dTDP-4-amino-4,6-dideoxygalactose transaminase